MDVLVKAAYVFFALMRAKEVMIVPPVFFALMRAKEVM